jgi:hypothetical protein
MYVIKRLDQGGGYASDPNRNGTGSSYTPLLQRAKTFPTREAAEADRCPGNEIVLSLDEAMQH